MKNMNNETMSIEKGLRTFYLKPQPERTETPFGDKVQYTGKNGYEIQHENLPFKVGDILTIKEIYVDRSYSNVEFIEFPNQQFNTVLFKDYKL